MQLATSVGLRLASVLLAVPAPQAKDTRTDSRFGISPVRRIEHPQDRASRWAHRYSYLYFFHSIDGSGNNCSHPEMGAAGTPLFCLDDSD